VRRIKTITTSVLGVALAAGTVALATGPASAVPRTCTSGTTGWQVNHGLSTSEATVWFVKGTAGISRPSQCMQLRPEVTWKDPTSGLTLHAYGGWITTQLPTESTAFGPDPGPRISSAREERQWVGGTHRECRSLYPIGPPNTSWHPCTGLKQGAHLVASAGPVPPCWRATYHATSGSPAIHIVFCLPGKRPAGSRELDITNDGSDAGRIDRGDVLISGWYPPPSR